MLSPSQGGAPLPGQDTTLPETVLKSAATLDRWVATQEVLDEIHNELEAQIAQHGPHPFVNDLPDERDELVQLGSRVVQAIRMHDQERADATAP